MNDIVSKIPVQPLTEADKKELEAFSLSRWIRDFLKVDLTVAVCGFTVFEYHYPPKKEDL